MSVPVFGRRDERRAIEDVLAAASGGRSGALVITGEAGIGKSHLLDNARALAEISRFRVEHIVGMESETPLAFAALHRLCAPLLAFAHTLSEPQARALDVAFGLRDDVPPDRFLVGLATLNLLAECGDDRPIVWLVDDAHWLDRASAEVIAFVARRVRAERVAVLIAMRDEDAVEPAVFAGIPSLTLEGLSTGDAHALLAATAPTPIDETLRDRVVAEARGNPLALLEFPLRVQPAHLASGFELPDASSTPRRLEESFRSRSSALPEPSQTILLIAAAEPTGNAPLLWRAAEYLGISGDAVGPAEASGLISIDSTVRFRHPLVRSALYHAADAADRRRVHEALAASIDPATDPDRHVWHRGSATVGTDAEVADELGRAATRALARGGMAAAAAFLQRATELTDDPVLRTQRALHAAAAKHEAGAPEDALKLLAIAESGPLDELQDARVNIYRAQIAFSLTRREDVPQKLLTVARALAPLEPAMSRETYLLALDTAIVTGGGHRDADVREVALAARAAPAAPDPPRPLDLLLEGLVTSYSQGHAESLLPLRHALAAFRQRRGGRNGDGDTDSDRWLWLAARTAVTLFDDELMVDLSIRNVRRARNAGAIASLHVALVAMSSTQVLTGDLVGAMRSDAEGEAIATATRAAPLSYAKLFLASWRGQRAETTGLFDAFVERPGSAYAEIAVAHYALAVLRNGEGRFAEALNAALRAAESDELAIIALVLPEVIEAAARSGQHARAAEAQERLSVSAGPDGTRWALGMAARSRALLASDGQDAAFREAIELLSGTAVKGYLARTHLVYGEWLRQGGDLSAAREQLRIAHDMLVDMGANGFAERAARELRAIGERTQAPDERPGSALTDHELHIAQLVAAGSTSREVAEALFLSPRTIDAHLRNIYRKLGISSRRQLREIRLV